MNESMKLLVMGNVRRDGDYGGRPRLNSGWCFGHDAPEGQLVIDLPYVRALSPGCFDPIQ